jgi:hypothetical protein
MNAYAAALAIDTEDDVEERRKALQTLINNGMAWTLQGRVGREAMAAIEAGECALGPESRRDYWGNRIPGRSEVVAGTKGSIEFVEAAGYEVAE